MPWWFFRKRRNRELDEEIQAHLDMAVRDRIEQGETREAAEQSVRREFGSMTLVKEATRDTWGFSGAQRISQDLRYAARSFVRTPIFTIVAVVSLTLAIGAMTAIAGLLHALVFRPLPVRDPYSLVMIGAQRSPTLSGNLSYPLYRELTNDQQVFTSLVGFTGIAVFDVQTDGEFARAATMGVTANFYTEFDIRPFAGRLFAPDDFTTAPAPWAVLGFSFWKRTFGDDLSIIGRTIRVDGNPLTVVGIAPKGFSNLNVAIEPAITVPLPTFSIMLARRPLAVPWTDDPTIAWVTTVGRLKPGVTLDQAQAHLLAIWPAIRASLAPTIGNPQRRQSFLNLRLTTGSAATGWENYGMRSQFTAPFYAVFGIAALVLLIACVNLASLLLSRTAARQSEIAIRVALGASRQRLSGQLFVEGLLLSVTSVAGGLALAIGVSIAFGKYVFANYSVPMSFNALPDVPVVAFACALAVLTAVLFSLAPVWMVLRYDPAASLQQQHRTVAQTSHVGRLLVATQIALCLALIATSGLLVRSLQEIRAIDIGVQVGNVVVAYPTPRPGAYTPVDNDLYYPELVERVGSMAGVDAVGIMQLKPLGGSPVPWNIGPSESHDSVASVYSSASPGLFNALGIPLLQGRDFTWSDNSRSRLVAIVSRTLAHRLFGNGNPVGREIRIGSDRELQRVEVVGVIADARVYDVKDTDLYAAYVPSLQRGSAANGKAIVIRGSVTLRDVNKTIEPLGREYVADMTSLAEILNETLLQERLTAAVAGFFGVLALVLSAIGLYGLMAYSVVQRRREICVRIALGAQVREILGEVLLTGLKLATAGVLGGLALAWATTTFVGSLLFNVQPHDPLTMGLAPVLLLLVATAACLLPAYRAARVDPAIALRAE
jgi:predicted permease